MQAQSYLYLNKKGDVPDKRWKQGDKVELLFSDGESDFWSDAYFEGGDSAGLYHGTRYYSFEEIKGVRYARGLMPLFASTAFAAAGLFTGIFAINGIINRDAPIVRQQQLFVGAGLVAIGIVLRPFAYQERKMEEGYYFKIISMRD